MSDAGHERDVNQEWKIPRIHEIMKSILAEYPNEPPKGDVTVKLREIILSGHKKKC